ncbi:MAG: sigma-70 family RNA polymerase sigma factor [Planctomycetaceae bacterium]|nr:sigma-70 family RNA polymerase sigma factor [Planctomycetaceae bacterium]
MPPQTRQSLILRLANDRDETAWRAFMEHYESFLTSLVSRQGVPQRHVPDVVQLVLMAIARSVSRWNPDGRPASFRRWLTTVSRNIVIRFMQNERKQVGGQGGSALLESLMAIESPPDEDQLRQYETEMIIWAAEQVRDEFLESSWLAFWQTFIEHRSVEEVAGSLGVSAGAVYMSRSRILARIRKLIAEVDEEWTIGG